MKCADAFFRLVKFGDMAVSTFQIDLKDLMIKETKIGMEASFYTISCNTVSKTPYNPITRRQRSTNGL